MISLKNRDAQQVTDEDGHSPASGPAGRPGPENNPLADIPSLEIGKVLDSLPYYVMLVDADHHISFANKPARVALGRTQEELQGSYCPKEVHGLDHPYPGCPLEAAVKGIEFEREYFDEATGRWSLLSAYPTGILNDKGKQLYYHAVQDITDKKQAQMEREATEQKFRDLFDGSIDIIFIADAEGRLLELNQAGFAFLGLADSAELAGFDIFRDLGFSRPLWRRFCREVMAQGSVANYELELKHRDGSPALISVTANAIIDEYDHLTVIRGIARDQTRQRQLEQELSQAQRLESVGRLAGGVAHDFNNYLVAIEGAIKLVLEDHPRDDSGRELLEEALMSCSQAAGLARELLLFSRDQKVELKPVNVNDSIEATLAMLTRIVGPRVPVTTCLTDSPWPVAADEVSNG
ncbi:MAG: PAS domain S-box protein, partial [Thermoleophilia bacterium]